MEHGALLPCLETTAGKSGAERPLQPRLSSGKLMSDSGKSPDCSTGLSAERENYSDLINVTGVRGLCPGREMRSLIPLKPSSKSRKAAENARK
jgi:hypothetical protein